MRTVLALGLLALLAAPALADGEMKAGTVCDLLTAKHSRPYSLYVPSNYSPRVSWPLVISSHGRGGSGKGEIGAWVGLAKEHGFIVACPDMCSATVNRPPTSKLPAHEEDDEVVLSIVEEVGAKFRLNRRAVMITGFSGGGNPSYYSGLRHPDVFTHICTRGGNFAPQQIPADEAVKAAGRKRLTIFIFYGDNDHPLILGTPEAPGQAKQAFDALKAAGYENVTIEEVAGMGHQSRPEKAADWFGAFLEAGKKMFRAGDEADEMLDDARAEIADGKIKNALRTLDKLEKHEKKNELEGRADAERAKIEAMGQARIEEAKKAWSAGDSSEAVKILGLVIRDFRGLPCEEHAKELKKEWEE